MKIERRNIATESALNLSVMADISFLLLIFFLVTSKFEKDFIVAQQLPEKSESISSKSITFIDIKITNDSLYYNQNPIEQSTFKTQLKKDILTQLSTDSSYQVVLSYDPKTTYSSYINIYKSTLLVYDELRADKLDVSLERYLALDQENSTSTSSTKEEIPIKITEKIIL